MIEKPKVQFRNLKDAERKIFLFLIRKYIQGRFRECEPTEHEPFVKSLGLEKLEEGMIKLLDDGRIKFCQNEILIHDPSVDDYKVLIKGV